MRSPCSTAAHLVVAPLARIASRIRSSSISTFVRRPPPCVRIAALSVVGKEGLATRSGRPVRTRPAGRGTVAEACRALHHQKRKALRGLRVTGAVGRPTQRGSVRSVGWLGFSLRIGKLFNYFGRPRRLSLQDHVRRFTRATSTFGLSAWILSRLLAGTT